MTTDTETGTGEGQAGQAGQAGTIQGIFATPIARFPHPGAPTFNHLIADTVILRLHDPNELYAYKKETLMNMNQWGDPVIERLTTWVLACARQMVEAALPQELARSVKTRSDTEGVPQVLSITVGNSWASVYEDGDQHPPHNHPNTAITAIYYVQGSETCELELPDPRPGIDYYDPGLTFGGASKNVHLHCSPGELVLFPGWLWHGVPPFHGDRNRISPLGTSTS